MVNKCFYWQPGNLILSCFLSPCCFASLSLAILPIYMWNNSHAQLQPWPFALAPIMKALMGQLETENSFTLACVHLY